MKLHAAKWNGARAIALTSRNNDPLFYCAPSRACLFLISSLPGEKHASSGATQEPPYHDFAHQALINLRWRYFSRPPLKIRIFTDSFLTLASLPKLYLSPLFVFFFCFNYNIKPAHWIESRNQRVRILKILEYLYFAKGKKEYELTYYISQI